MTATSDPLRERLIRVARDGSFRYADIVDRILVELANSSDRAELVQRVAGLRSERDRALECEAANGKLLDQVQAELALLRELETWARRFTPGLGVLRTVLSRIDLAAGVEATEQFSLELGELLARLDALRAKAGT